MKRRNAIKALAAIVVAPWKSIGSMLAPVVASSPHNVIQKDAGSAFLMRDYAGKWGFTVTKQPDESWVSERKCFDEIMTKTEAKEHFRNALKEAFTDSMKVINK